MAGTALLVIGLMYYVRAKGYHPVWGLWGLVPMIGPVLLLVQRPRPPVSPRETVNAVVLQEDPHIRAFAERGRRRIIGGWPLLLIMAPLGVLTILFSAHLPRAIAPGEPLVLETSQTPVPPAAGTLGAPAAKLKPEESAAQPQREAPPDTSVKQERPPENAPPSEGKQEEIPGASATDQAGPAVQKKPDTAVPTGESPYVARFRQIKKGMPYDEVCALVGDNIVVVSSMPGGDKIVKWENPDKSYFAARFHNDVLERTTSLNFPPMQKGLREMAAELGAPAGSVSETKEKAGALKPTEAAAEQEPAIKEAEAENRPNSEEKQTTDTGQESAETTAKTEGASEETSDENAVSQKRESVVRVGKESPPARRVRKARLPRYSQSLKRGPHDVHIHNLGDVSVQVGLRAGTKRGTNLSIPPGGVASVYLANGTYTLYYISSSEPQTLRNAGSFGIASPPNAVHIEVP
jgi:hypothetical protein